MPYTLVDSFNTGDDGHSSILSNQWLAQSFTTSKAYTIKAIKIKAYKALGTPGIWTVGIYDTSSDKPTGSALCTGTIDASTFTGTPGAWYEVTLGAGAALSSGTVYAIRISSSDNASNYSLWRMKDPSTAYSGGKAYYSSNSGSTWLADGTGPNYGDHMFETYEEGGTLNTKTIVDSITYSDSVSKKITGKKVIETATYTATLKKFISKLKTEARTWTDTLTQAKVLLKTISESFSSADTVAKRQAGKGIKETVNYSVAFTNQKTIGKYFLESRTYTDTIAKIKVIHKSITDAIAHNDTISKTFSMGKIFFENTTWSELWYGKKNGINMKYFSKYTERAGTYIKKYFNR